MLNVDIKVQLIPNNYLHQTSILAAKHSSRLNSFILLSLRRNLQRNSLALMKSLHDQARTQLHYDFQIVYVLSIQYFTLEWNSRYQE